MKPSEKLFHRYEYLAKRYANRIFSYHELSFEYEDLIQEFKVKIFTAIKAYGRRWLAYRIQGYAKPVPLKHYLECACGNLCRDFIKYISNENNKMRIDETGYDFGYDSGSVDIDTANMSISVNGVDLLTGLEGDERKIFYLHMQGYNNVEITKVIGNNVKSNKITEIVQRQKNDLRNNFSNELRNSITKYEYFTRKN